MMEQEKKEEQKKQEEVTQQEIQQQKQQKAQEKRSPERSEGKEKRVKKIKIAVEEFNKLKAAFEEKGKLQDKYLRLMAEFENFKKRMYKEQEQFLQFSNEQILLKLLPIIDDFDRAHQAAREHKHGEVFSKGVEMILNQLHKLLKDNGVEKIKTVGEKFNPHLHEAIATVQTEEYPEDTACEEVSPGYILNGRLLRAAKVRIAQGIKEQKEEEKGEDKNG